MSGGMRPAVVAQLGDRIRAARQQQELSVGALAELSEVSRRMLTQIELGQANPSVATLDRIAAGLGTTFAALMGAGLLGLWSFQHADYAGQPFWRMMVDADAARSIRAWAGAAIALFAFGLWRMVSTAATPQVVGETDTDFQRVRQILARAEVAEPGSNLALLGDKRFLFSPSGESFLMFGVRGRSWIALGAPVAVSCDNCPPLNADVTYIADVAEYTPPVIYSREERAKLVYLVEARPREPSAARPGQPVTVTLAGAGR